MIKSMNFDEFIENMDLFFNNHPLTLWEVIHKMYDV